MDWENAISRSKFVSSSGTIESLTNDLHLVGNFKKTKTITWLTHPVPSTHSIADITLPRPRLPDHEEKTRDG